MNQFVELIQFYESFMACLLVYDRFDLHVVLVSNEAYIFFFFEATNDDDSLLAPTPIPQPTPTAAAFE